MTSRSLAGVLAAIAVALTGTRVSAIALPWFVYVSTGSAVYTGMVTFAEMAPYVLVKALAGPMLDRVGPRRVSWAADVVSAAAAGALVLLHALVALPPGALVALVAVIGAARGPGDLAKEIMIPEAAERGRVPLERATGLMGVTERLAQTAGPAAGGAIVLAVGPMASLGVSAGCFALGSLIVAWALPAGMGHRAPAASPAREGYWRRFGQGLTFLRGQPLLLALAVVVGVTNLLDAAFSQVLVTVWAKESGHGPGVVGLNSSVMGLTAVGGSLLAAALAHRMRRRPVFFVAFLLAGPPRFLALAAGLPVWAIVAVFAVSGFAGGFLNPILGAITYERVPRELLGRVGALGTSLAWAGIPLGGLLAGAAVSLAGLAPVLLACGTAYALVTSVTGLRREWREMDRLRGRPAAAPVPGGGTGTPAGGSHGPG
ncbi:MFS transporter [[Actinomadura] parvosata subsp. kistnae]|uniref:Multidrug efflux pump Tap n=1 Tax=[Actinomadura] parvosata subsp. kistnae TaxID=1909395 RepID=A0A1U9ZU95_9ACTN|nr:MFS transporter [Nonomuraea sp. ATCC 55076]AQZ61515.1 MFS transporter [Nonomuraea sp. ATCC 55076]